MLAHRVLARKDVAVILALAATSGCVTRELRKFPDRPVAWYEHDDRNLTRLPREDRWTEARGAHLLRDSVILEVDRSLSLESPRPADDVNATDEVGCSTWYCPRNHLVPMSEAELRAGPPNFPAPVPPITIKSGKRSGFSPGWVVEDANGKKFIMKYDPPKYLGLISGAETLGPLIFHALGYNVPKAFILDLDRNQLELAPDAGYNWQGTRRKYVPGDIDDALKHAARTPEGKIRFLLISFLPGKILGAFDFQGKRWDDPNDKIPHQHRRSLRASKLFYAWITYADAGANNTIDSVIEEDGRRFVRHHIVDFGAAFGALTTYPKPPFAGTDHEVDVKTWTLALLTLGLESRDFQNQRVQHEELIRRYPGVGFFPVEGWTPDDFRANYIIPAHQRMTAADAYWGAKVITAFTDEQLRAMVTEARLTPDESAYLAQTLATRRDVIGRRHLLPLTALEKPRLDGDRLCFEDLAIARKLTEPGMVRYAVSVREEGLELLEAEHPAAGAETCVPAGAASPRSPGEADPYRVVWVTSTIKGKRAKPARVHLRWREGEGRWVIVGVDRDG